MSPRASRSAAISICLFLPLTGPAGGCRDETAATGDQASAAGKAGMLGARGGAGAPASGAAAGGAGKVGAEAGAKAQAGTGGVGVAGAAGEPSNAARIERADVPADSLPRIDLGAYSSLIAELNRFGLELGKRQAEDNQLTTKNCLYSPLSVSIALSMAYAGARGETAIEMGRMLSVGVPVDTYHAGVSRLTRELGTRARTEIDAKGFERKVELNIADAMYMDQTLTLGDAFLEQLARNYDSGVHREDFRGAYEAARAHINDWVADNTHDKILDLLPAGSLDATTRLVLVNALYFYGSWQDKFIPEGTRNADFHTLAGQTVSVPTMHSQFLVRYAMKDSYAAVELPYVGGQLSMLVVVPNRGQFETVRAAVSSAWLADAVASVDAVTVNLALPKLKLTVGTFSLRDSLEAMGMKLAFTDNADFTGISTQEPLQIQDVLHKAFIAVDESGTEAAAATAVTFAGSSAPNNVVDLKVDRPFLFFIRDASGAVLFFGHVVDPSEQ